MPRFNLLRPHSLADASEMLIQYGDDARPIAGGTALQIFMHLGLLRAPYMVDLSTLPGLSGIAVEDDEIVIGAMTPLAEVARNPALHEQMPALVEAYARIANPRVRSTATVGGNLCHGDYRIDPPAMLLPLSAELEIHGPHKWRRVPLNSFFTGLEETDLRPGEILTSIRIPMSALPDRAVFRKFSSLAANDWPCFGIGMCLWLREDGGIRQARAGVTAMAPTPLLIDLPLLAGKPITAQLAVEAGEMVAQRIDPIVDLRGSVAYKRKIAAVCTADAVRAAWEGHADGHD